MDNNRTIKKIEECLTASCCRFRTCPYTDIEWDALEESLSTMKSQQAEIERLKQEKADAVKRIEHCRQNCISGEKDCDIAYNKSGKELYRAKADAYKQALDIINEPSI